MRTFLVIGATVGISLYAIMLARHGIGRAHGNRAVRRRQRSGGGMYGQINSVTGRVNPPGLGLSIWFLLLVCVVILVKIWWF